MSDAMSLSAGTGQYRATRQARLTVRARTGRRRRAVTPARQKVQSVNCHPSHPPDRRSASSALPHKGFRAPAARFALVITLTASGHLEAS